jgi:hypothetical protein
MTHPMMRTWGVQYVLPTMLLLFSLFILFPFIDDPDMIWILVATPLAIALGFIARPERVWITPLAVALILATVIVIGALMGNLEPRDSLPMLYVWMMGLVGLPLVVWIGLGRGLRSVWDDR